jgi:hypothetical protein
MLLDSYHYVYAAARKLNINIWPIGYSYFIRLTGIISHDSLFFTTLQFVIFQTSLFFFYKTLCLFLKFPLWGNILFLIFIFFNPIILYTSNLVMADALFTSLSILWIGLLLRLMYSPKKYMLIAIGLIAVIALSVRYNALYYPIVGCLAFLICRERVYYKLIGIVLQILFLFTFVTFTKNEEKKVTGYPQFSPFGGWKVASNALYIFPHIDKNKEQHIPADLQRLDSLTRAYFNSPYDTVDLLTDDVSNGSYYMFQGEAPLKQYMYLTTKEDTGFSGIRRQGLMGPIYQRFGTYVILNNAFCYGRYFILPNIHRFFIPPTEVFTSVYAFYLRPDGHGPVGAKWFGLKSLDAPVNYIMFREKLFNVYQLFMLPLHLLFILSLIGFFVFRIYKRIPTNVIYMFAILLLVWLAGTTFSLISSAIVLRYLIFSIIVESTFILLFAIKLSYYKSMLKS